MRAHAPRGLTSSESSLRAPLRRGLSVLAAAGAFLLWAARRGFFNSWPV
jgi:hypothetical protein